MAKPRLGIALGSGGAKGWAHIGVLQSLRKLGVEIDVVCGCSMGALVGAAYACGKLDELNSFATGLTSGGVLKLLDVALAGGGLINGKRIVELLGTLGVAGSIEELGATFAAVATDLESGREIWLRDGAIVEAVRASIAIPGIFNPVSRDRRWLADGALVNPVPVSLCRALGAEIIIAVNVSAGSVTKFASKSTSARQIEASANIARTLSEQTPELLRQPIAALATSLFPPAAVSPGYFDVLLNALNIMEEQITRSRLAGEPPHLLVAPRIALEPLEFHRASEAIAAGFEAMDEAAPALRRLLA